MMTHFTALLVALFFAGACSATPLDDYVNTPDPAYDFKVIKVYPEQGYTLYILNMTSQTWYPDKVPTNPVWWHYLCITVPAVIRRPNSSFLFIGGGNTDDGVPTPTDRFVAHSSVFAVGAGSVAAMLQNVPNQPLVFTDDPSKQMRYEDAIVAWTWKTFILEDPNDPYYLLYMPMTKAAVRAMDTIEIFAKAVNPQLDINGFMVAGASKRGWTTWLTAAVDKRVIAAAPIVMDDLNFVKNLHHHYRAYGGWTFALEDYYMQNITAHIDDPNTQKMADIIDPYSYRDRLTMPKVVISTVGDEFFLPDDSHYYLQDMKGETFVRMLPNIEHSVAGYEPNLFTTMRAFYTAVVDNFPLPQFTWQLQQTPTGGRIVVNTNTTPISSNMFYAFTTDAVRRDFRLFKLDPKTSAIIPNPATWFPDGPVQTMSNGTYFAEYNRPPTGWLAFFIYMAFAAPDGTFFEFTTETMVIPDMFPYPDCSGASCYGTLL